MQYTDDYKIFLAKNQLVTYSELSDKLQDKVRTDVVTAEQLIYQQQLNDSKKQVKENIHLCINTSWFLPSLVQRKRFITRLANNQKHLIGYIEENLMEFYADGTQKKYPV